MCTEKAFNPFFPEAQWLMIDGEQSLYNIKWYNLIEWITAAKDRLEEDLCHGVQLVSISPKAIIKLSICINNSSVLAGSRVEDF